MLNTSTGVGSLFLILVLATGSTHAASNPIGNHFGHGSATGDSSHALTDAFAPYLQDTALIRKKLYEHMQQSESFIKFQSLVEYLWLQRTENR